MTKYETKQIKICLFGMRSLLHDSNMSEEDKEVANSVAARSNNLLLKKESDK